MSNADLLKRTRHSFQTTQGVATRYQNQSYINFARNDYLGLSQHPQVKNAAIKAIHDYGASASASPLVTGYSELAQAFEEEMASHLGTEKVLLFSSGTSANYALMHHLSQSQAPILADKLIHASLIDGILSNSTSFARFKHNCPHDLEHYLQNPSKNIKNIKNIKSKRKPSNSTQATQQPNAHIVTESIFSMEGDFAPVKALESLAHTFDAKLIVDESHALGVIGPTGAGLCKEKAITPYAISASLGKALGSQGGLIAASNHTITQLTQTARPLIYSTGLAPSAIAAALESLRLMKSTPSILNQLHDNIAYFKNRATHYELTTLKSASAIQGIVIPDIATLTQVHQHIWQQGFITGLIRPPTVPPNTSRLRICLSALHTQKHIDTLLHCLKCAITKC